MLRLSKPVQLSSHINIVCLPAKEDRFSTGTPCITAGWGHSAEGFFCNCTIFPYFVLFYKPIFLPIGMYSFNAQNIIILNDQMILCDLLLNYFIVAQRINFFIEIRATDVYFVAT